MFRVGVVAETVPDQETSAAMLQIKYIARMSFIDVNHVYCCAVCKKKDQKMLRKCI